MARLARWQDKTRARRIFQLDQKTQRGADGLRVGIGMAIKAEIDRHAVAGGRERADAEQRLQ